jgi:RimJ/RimL family protein N-acetyltransferase
MAGSWVLLGFGFFSVIEKTSGQWIGYLGPIQPEGWPGTEVGYTLIPAARGKGYAVEGAAATIDWAFATLGWTDVIHTINPENSASQAVARRLGAMNRGPGLLPAPHEHLSIDIWGQTRQEWEQR